MVIGGGPRILYILHICIQREIKGSQRNSGEENQDVEAEGDVEDTFIFEFRG